MNCTSRFLSYVKKNTQSDPVSSASPSTSCQMDLARYLAEELRSEGLEDVRLTPDGYLYATLPANTDKQGVPTIGFIAHLDTSPDASGCNVCPRIVHNYDGSDIVLRPASVSADGTVVTSVVSSPIVFPELLDHVGEDLIVTDGTTLLGADDKAGIAEIVEAMCYLRQHPEIKHGCIRIAFTPDEEIGSGAHLFDIEGFGAAFAYTVDGGEVGELEYENFNAASASITVRGVSVHPGYAKGKLINASRILTQFLQMLPQEETPEHTEGRDGFYHIMSVSGDVEHAESSIIIRDHDADRFVQRKQYVQQCAEKINSLYGDVLTVTVTDSYHNMIEQIRPVMHVVDYACEAFSRADVPLRIVPIRGGTDGAQLSFRGLPCPNIFTGVLNMHGPHEFIPVPSLHKAMQVIINICQIVEEKVC